MTQAQMQQPQFRSSGNRRRNTAIAIAAVVLVGSSLIAWRVLAKRPMPQDQAVKIVMSDAFKGLPHDQQKQIVDAVKDKPIILKDGQIPEDQLAAIRKRSQDFRQQMMDEYFKLTDAKAKKAYLDKLIDQQEQVRKMMENQDKPGGDNGNGMKVMVKTGGGGAAAQKSMGENTPPALQAQSAQFMKDIQDRRAERGLPPTQGLMIVRMNTSGGPH